MNPATQQLPKDLSTLTEEELKKLQKAFLERSEQLENTIATRPLRETPHINKGVFTLPSTMSSPWSLYY